MKTTPSQRNEFESLCQGESKEFFRHSLGLFEDQEDLNTINEIFMRHLVFFDECEIHDKKEIYRLWYATTTIAKSLIEINNKSNKITTP